MSLKIDRLRMKTFNPDFVKFNGYLEPQDQHSDEDLSDNYIEEEENVVEENFIVEDDHVEEGNDVNGTSPEERAYVFLMNSLVVVVIIFLLIMMGMVWGLLINDSEKDINKNVINTDDCKKTFNDFIVERIKEPYEIHVLKKINHKGREDLESIGIEYMGSNLFKFPEGVELKKMEKMEELYNNQYDRRYCDGNGRCRKFHIYYENYFVVKNDDILISIVDCKTMGNRTVRKYSDPPFERFENLQRQEYKDLYNYVYERGNFHKSCDDFGEVEWLLEIYENLLNEKSRKEVLPFPCIKKKILKKN